MHFHWLGSEHTVDGERFGAELHLVHQSLSNPHNYAVLGYLFRTSNKYASDNVKLTPIIDKLDDVIEFNTTSEVSLDLFDLLPAKVSHYFRYPGSLTTPSCDEIVEWFVIDSPVLEISQDQLLAFQDVEDAHGKKVDIEIAY